MGGQLRLARGAALPLDTASGVDPIRALLAAPGPLRAGEWVRVQVLARPVSSARLARTARSNPRPRGGRVVGAVTTAMRAVIREVLDVAVPGPRARTARPDAGYGLWPPRARMLEIAQDRAAVGKARGGGYETRIRYATATPRSDTATPVAADLAARREQTGAPPLTTGPSAAAGRATRAARPGARCPITRGTGRGRWWRVVRMRWRPRSPRSPDTTTTAATAYAPATAITARRLGRGDVLSVPELAALAHLPSTSTCPGCCAPGPPQSRHPHRPRHPAAG